MYLIPQTHTKELINDYELLHQKFILKESSNNNIMVIE